MIDKPTLEAVEKALEAMSNSLRVKYTQCQEPMVRMATQGLYEGVDLAREVVRKISPDEQ